MEIVLYIYNGLTALDCIGPYEVLSRLPDADVKFVADKKGVVVADTHFLKLVAERDITEVDRADILVIPGSTVGFVREAKKKRVLDWIRRLHETTQWTTSVCSGSIILAATGLLEGLPASSHWGTLHLLEEYGAVPTPERYVRSGKIVTAQGVSAGIDMALYLVTEILGEEKAKAYQLALEYFPAPPVDSGSFAEADERVVTIARKALERDARKDLSLMDTVRNAQMLLKMRRRI